MDNRAIGVFDSGVGGLSLWREIKHLLPNESIIYFGDGKHCPYGERSRDEIISYAIDATEQFIAQDCKMIVIACNTATSMAICVLREKYPDMIFVGMEPAIKPACQQTKSGVVAVLATKRSLSSEAFANKIKKYAIDGIKVITQVGEGFVEIVEHGEEKSLKAYSAVKSIVEPLLAKHVDKIVLGCTHYPFLMSHFLELTKGLNVEIIDPSSAIIKRINQLLEQRDIKAEQRNDVKYSFSTFADCDYLQMLRDRANTL